VPVTRRPPREARRSVKLDDQSSRGVVKHLNTRVARRGFVSDGRAAAAQAMVSPRASDDSTKCTCLASRLQKSKRSIFPGPCGGEAVAAGASSRRTTSPRERGVARNGSSCPSDGGERSGAGKRVPEHPGCASEQHAVGGHRGRETTGRFDGRRFGPRRRHALTGVARERPWRCGEPSALDASRATGASGPGRRSSAPGPRCDMKRQRSWLVSWAPSAKRRRGSAASAADQASATSRAHRCDRSCRG